MRTAISVPDDTFDRASARAPDLGISRSEFFATAAQHYLDELDAESVTRGSMLPSIRSKQLRFYRGQRRGVRR